MDRSFICNLHLHPPTFTHVTTRIATGIWGNEITKWRVNTSDGVAIGVWWASAISPALVANILLLRKFLTYVDWYVRKIFNKLLTVERKPASKNSFNEKSQLLSHRILSKKVFNPSCLTLIFEKLSAHADPFGAVMPNPYGHTIFLFESNRYWQISLMPWTVDCL